MLVVYHYARFKLSMDDDVELMATRGFTLSHQTVHNWVQTFGTTLGLHSGINAGASAVKNGTLMRPILKSKVIGTTYTVQLIKPDI